MFQRRDTSFYKEFNLTLTIISFYSISLTFGSYFIILFLNNIQFSPEMLLVYKLMTKITRPKAKIYNEEMSEGSKVDDL